LNPSFGFVLVWFYVGWLNRTTKKVHTLLVPLVVGVVWGGCFFFVDSLQKGTVV
jgi:hypothetical protein